MAGKSGFRLLVSAGEPSGDLIAGQVIQKIRSLDTGTRFFGMGGPEMESAGCDISRPLPSVMGLGSPFGNIQSLAASMFQLAAGAAKMKADAAILVDFPDFHMQLATILKALGIPVFQFVSPQIWAWRGGRIKKIKRLYKKTFLIFPFEREIYEKAGASCEFVGHPAVDRLHNFPDRAFARKELGIDETETVVALLPGSRKAVFERNLPVIMSAAERLSYIHPGVGFVLSTPAGGAFAGDSSFRIIERPRKLTVSEKPGPLILRAADAAIVSSGTAALESAILGTPFAGVYVTSEFTYRLVKTFISVDRILMANLLTGRDVVREFIQYDARPDAIADEISSLLNDKNRRTKMAVDFSEITAMLGPFDAAGRVAASLIDFCRNKD